MFKLKDEKQGWGGVICDSFRLTGRSFAPNIIVVLLFILAMYIVLTIVGKISGHPLAAIINAVKASSESRVMQINAEVFTRHMLISFFIGGFIIIWIAKIANAIIVRSCWNHATTGSSHLGNACAIGFKYFYVYLIQMLVVIAVVVAKNVILFFLSRLGYHWLDVVVTILLQLVVYYIIIKLILVDASAVIDDCGMRGFARSWSYISGNWWRTLGVMAFAEFFYIVFIYTIGIGIAAVILFPGVNPPFEAALLTSLPMWFVMIMTVVAIVTVLSLILTFPTLIGSSQTVLYHDLKHRR